jgi:hypothetical protein
MTNRFLWFLLTTMILVGCNRCKDDCDDPSDPACPNYVGPVDPCANAVETSAHFTMRQSPNPNGAVADTLIQFYRECLVNKPITLRASMDSCSYHWIIGADHYYNQKVTFYFSVNYVNQEIPITLIVTRTPQNECFPNDNGTDTLTKIIVPKFGCESAIWGKYFGAWDESPLDSFAIELIPSPDDWPNCNDQVKLINLNPMAPGDTCIANSLRMLYNFIEIDDTYVPCFWPLGAAYLDSTAQNIKIEYSIIQEAVNNAPRSYHVFRGYRIH